jgi:hypothetical protein
MSTHFVDIIVLFVAGALSTGLVEIPFAGSRAVASRAAARGSRLLIKRRYATGESRALGPNRSN